MSIIDSLRRAVDHLPGGRAVIAARLAKTDEVMRKELSSATSHKLGALDALSIARICVEAGSAHCYDYAAFVAQECGGEFRPRAATEKTMGEKLSPVQRVTTMVRETSDVTSSVINAMSDEVITDNEMAYIEQEIAEAHESLRKVEEAARRVHAAGKPAFLKVAA